MIFWGKGVIGWFLSGNKKEKVKEEINK